MWIPIWLLGACSLLLTGLVIWTYLLVTGRNPLPFPDQGSRIFAASSLAGKEAFVALLARHGLKERFQFNSDGVSRSIMWDGTIINHSSEEVSQKLGLAAASIGLVADDPVESAKSAATYLQSCGFDAQVVLDAEPDLPIAFVVTNAMASTVLNFRKHVIHLPRPQSVSQTKPRSS
jgi:hypothetical protein